MEHHFRHYRRQHRVASFLSVSPLFASVACHCDEESIKGNKNPIKQSWMSCQLPQLHN